MPEVDLSKKRILSMAKLPKADKDLGQHFLRDQNVISKITNDFTEECDVIIEVGPGPAVLTQHLAKHEKPLYIIEKDTRFIEFLDEYVKKENQFIQDALKFEWKKFLKDHKLNDKKIWLVSNLPYNVGTVLFTQFLTVPQIKYMSLMFQKEVGEKTYIREVKNQMNGLLTLSLNYFKSKALIKVAPGAFTPPPKVDSIVVSYERIEDPEISIKDFKKLNIFTRLLFSNKRKQISSVLKAQYSKDQLANAFEKSNIGSNLRAEALSFKEVIQLFKCLHSSL